MGNDAVILWLTPELALAYFGAVIVGMIGLLQLVAARWHRDDLRWLPPGLATPVGLALGVGALLVFYLTQYPLIFVPGPAGSELMLLFGVGTALATWLSRGLAWLVGRR